MSNKVNANTKELEFKRKHNNLVDNVEELAENLEEIPNVEEAESGTIVNALGLDSEGKLVKGAINSGLKLYKHTITYKYGSVTQTSTAIAISTRSEAYFTEETTSFSQMFSDIYNKVILKFDLYPGFNIDGPKGPSGSEFFDITWSGTGGGGPQTTLIINKTLRIYPGTTAKVEYPITGYTVTFISDVVTEY